MPAVKKSELKQACLAILKQKMADCGFAFRASKDTFYRKSVEKTDIFQLVWLTGGTLGYRIQPDMGVRHEIVEKIFHHTSGMPLDSHQNTATVGGGVGNILTGSDRSCEFEIVEVSDVETVCQGIMNVFHETAEPYFERFSTLEAIDVELNDKPNERTPHRALSWFRCSTGIIVARLVGRRNYQELAAIYEEKMRIENKGFYLGWFVNLLKSLEDDALLQ